MTSGWGANPELFLKICSYENLQEAYKRARKRKTKKHYVKEFENNRKNNIVKLMIELHSGIYKPIPLETFILRDPKTRKISKSDFRDRVIHHAICNIIEPIFDKTFIYDSYANRKGKGTSTAIKRFDYFKRKITKNNTRHAYVLKADVKHFFDEVKHDKLLEIIGTKIKDNLLILLIKTILDNHHVNRKGVGMPLGNLTSQFFANIYLNELDQYVKHNLKIKYYIRYVDDIVVFGNCKEELILLKETIDNFLRKNLGLQLHPDKSDVHRINQGVPFLGLRIYNKHRLLAKRNVRKIKKKLKKLTLEYEEKKISYDKLFDVVEGWVAYSKIANTYKLKSRLIAPLYSIFSENVSTKQYSKYFGRKKLKKNENVFNDFRFTYIMKGALYMDDSYLKEFEAVVEEVKDGKFVVLNQTAFYPNGGGQPFDTGIIKSESGEEFKVVFVGKFDGKISHEVDKPGLAVGDKVRCVLDWNKRYSYMRYHTAAHIVSSVLHREAGAKITGNQIYEDKLRIDFDLENFDREIIQKYIDIANKEIAKNQDVKTYYLSRDDAMSIPGVVKLAGALPPTIDTLRIVEIGDVDLQADGGTHIKNTSEIGSLEIQKAENKGKSNRRIYLILN